MSILDIMRTINCTKDILEHIQSGDFRTVCEILHFDLPFAVHFPTTEDAPYTLCFRDDAQIEGITEIFRDCIWSEPS